MRAVRVAGVGLLGPGLPGWDAGRAILAGTAPWQAAEVPLPPPAILPATERRRTTSAVRLALAAAAEAAAASGLPAGSLRPVFGSGNGDSTTVAAILDAITRPDGFVSPTQFHNSVHNAAAGYWSIGTASATPATCLGCHDWTVGAALMKAVAECAAEAEPVLLCWYDVAMPEPIHAKRPVDWSFGAALVLTPHGTGPTIEIAWEADPPPDASPFSPDQPWLTLASRNPAARSLPLLAMLAREERGTLHLPLLDGALRVALCA